MVVGLARALGLRGTIVLACLLVLAVTVYGVAQDLGLIDPPARVQGGPASEEAGHGMPAQADLGRGR
jgi:hypothetical protein